MALEFNGTTYPDKTTLIQALAAWVAANPAEHRSHTVLVHYVRYATHVYHTLNMTTEWTAGERPWTQAILADGLADDWACAFAWPYDPDPEDAFRQRIRAWVSAHPQPAWPGHDPLAIIIRHLPTT